MQIQRGIKKDSSLAKFVLGAHPIIEHFIDNLHIRVFAASVQESF